MREKRKRRAGDSTGLGPRRVLLRMAQGDAGDGILQDLAIVRSRFSRIETWSGECMYGEAMIE